MKINKRWEEKKNRWRTNLKLQISETKKKNQKLLYDKSKIQQKLEDSDGDYLFKEN